MINFENTQIYPVFKAIFQNKHVQTDYFAQNFQCNELENTITKITNIYNYCDDFNEWFKQVHTIDIEHTIGEEKSLELGVIGVVKFIDHMQKDLAAYIKLDNQSKISVFKFYVNTHIDKNLYRRKI